MYPEWKVLKNKGLNINSILPKIEQLRSLLFNSNISVLEITETKLDKTVNNEEVKLDNYDLIRSDRNKKGGGIACYIKTSISFNYHGSLSENFENILIDILLPKYQPIMQGIICRPHDQSSFIDNFNIALKELASQGNETYFLGHFNINLFFEGHYVLKKSFAKLKEAQSNQILLKPYLEICSAFGLTQLLNKPTRSTLNTSSLLDHILTNLKESITQHGVITLRLSNHDFIFCTRKIKCFKSRKHNTVSVKTYKNYSKKLLEERLTKMKIPSYLLCSCTDLAYNHLSKILQDTINDIAPAKDIRIKGNTKPWFDSNMIGLIRKRDKLQKMIFTYETAC